MNRLKDFREHKIKKIAELKEKRDSLVQKMLKELSTFFTPDLLSEHQLRVSLEFNNFPSVVIKLSSSNSQCSFSEKPVLDLFIEKTPELDLLDIKSNILFLKEVPINNSEFIHFSVNLKVFSQFTSKLFEKEDFVYYIKNDLKNIILDLENTDSELRKVNMKSEESIKKDIIQDFTLNFSKVGAKIPSIYLPVGTEKCLVSKLCVESEKDNIFTVSFMHKNKQKHREFRKISFNLVLCDHARNNPLEAEDALLKKEISDKIEKL